MEGVKVNQVDINGNVVATGSLVSSDSELGFINVDFNPIAAGSIGQYRLCFDGQQSANDYIGINKILSTQSGNLFGINTSNFSLWQGSTANLLGTRLTLSKYLLAIANAVNKSGLEGDLTCYINPRSFSTLTSDEAALRMYDSSYSPKKAQDGFESIEFFSQNGKTTFISHRCVKEGEAYALHLPDWSRSGSSEVSFTIPGMNSEIIFSLEAQAGYAFRSYSDQYIFCHAPARSLMIFGINDESSV